MNIYIFIIICIVLGAAVLLLLQLYLSTRRKPVAGLILPLFSLCGWLLLASGLIDLSDSLSLSARGVHNFQLIFLLCLLACSAVYVASRLLRRQNLRIREDERRKRLEIKEQRRQAEQQLIDQQH